MHVPLCGIPCTVHLDHRGQVKTSVGNKPQPLEEMVSPKTEEFEFHIKLVTSEKLKLFIREDYSDVIVNHDNGHSRVPFVTAQSVYEQLTGLAIWATCRCCNRSASSL